MERRIHFGIEDVFDIALRKQRYDSLKVTEGHGRGNSETHFQPTFKDKVSEFDAQVSAGKMEPRDWKCRYDGHTWPDVPPIVGVERTERILSLAIGPTSWGEWREDYKRSEEDATVLQKLGETKHQNQGFYLSNGLGAAVLTMTTEGDIVVGVRKSDSYDGAIHGAAGWMTFDRDISKINPFNDAYRELNEELAVQRDSVSALDLVGLVAYPKTWEADFVFVARTSKERDYFTSGAWKDAVDAREHRDLVVLANPSEIRHLLGGGKAPVGDKKYEVLASTAYGLEVLAEHWDKLR